MYFCMDHRSDKIEWFLPKGKGNLYKCGKPNLYSLFEIAKKVNTLP